MIHVFSLNQYLYTEKPSLEDKTPDDNFRRNQARFKLALWDIYGLSMNQNENEDAKKTKLKAAIESLFHLFYEGDAFSEASQQILAKLSANKLLNALDGLSLLDAFISVYHDHKNKLKEKGGGDNLLSLSFVGYCDKNKLIVATKVKEGFNHLLKAADKGCAFSQVMVGNSYELGAGTDKDERKAFDYYQKSANQNHGVGLFYIGMSYFYGKYCSQDREKALTFFQSAGLKNHGAASSMVGLYCIDQNDLINFDCNKAIFCFEKAIKLSDSPCAHYQMGFFYENGVKVTKNFTKAFEHYKKAEQLENNIIYIKLSQCYQDGIGVAKDLQMATLYDEKAKKLLLLEKSSSETKSEQPKKKIKIS